MRYNIRLACKPRPYGRPVAFPVDAMGGEGNGLSAGSNFAAWFAAGLDPATVATAIGVSMADLKPGSAWCNAMMAHGHGSLLATIDVSPRGLTVQEPAPVATPDPLPKPVATVATAPAPEPVPNVQALNERMDALESMFGRIVSLLEASKVTGRKVPARKSRKA